MTAPLSQRLREATHALHREVEHGGFMSALLRGQVPRSGYVLFLRNLHAIYSAMEAALQAHAAHPKLMALPLADIARRDALGADLQALHGPRWADLPLTTAAAAYAQHLQALADTQPLSLAAHAYVRYLGDLNGGQVVQRVVVKGFGLAPGEAVAFYDFGSAQRASALALAFRAGLDQLADDEVQAQALVDEACGAFIRHGQLFDELQPRAAGEPAPRVQSSA